MKQSLTILACLLSCIFSHAQVQSVSSKIPVQVSVVPSKEPLSLHVYTSNQQVQFLNGSDYSSSKTLPAYFQLNIKSSVPWVLTAIITDVHTSTHTAAGPDMLINLVGLKIPNSGRIIRLSRSPQMILQSTNNLAENDYNIDVIVDAPFNVGEGVFTEVVSFQLSPQ